MAWIRYSLPSLFNMLFFYWHSLIFIIDASITIHDLYSKCLYESYSSWTNFFTSTRPSKCGNSYPFFTTSENALVNLCPLFTVFLAWCSMSLVGDSLMSICSGTIYTRLTKFYSSCTVVIVLIKVLTFNQIGILFAVKKFIAVYYTLKLN